MTPHTRTIALLATLCIGLPSTGVRAAPADDDQGRKAQYTAAVSGGAGFMPWQDRGVSQEEIALRKEIEERKDQMLAARAEVRHPTLLTEDDIELIKRNVESADWARAWLASHKKMADYIVAQPDGYVENMIPELTPWYCYGMTCPNCVGKKSQEAMGGGVMRWSYRDPDVLQCRYCGQKYPDPRFPETAKLVCPRSGQVLTFYLNEEESRHPDDRTGKYAWRWVGHPTHVTFTGAIRERKVRFMIGAARNLALVYRLTDDARYAEKTVAILTRLAHCYRRWLYHDYWDAVADCDPMYAAWRDRDLRLEWKRHLCTSAYKNDTLGKARMLQSYWGAGRLHPSCDVATVLVGLSLAYDLVHGASGAGGQPLWTSDARAKVERDLFMEWIMGGEPFLGGAGKATNVNNKSGRVYLPMAQVARCLGLTEWADTALAGFEALEAKSLAYDGFSHESPAYTFSSASYLGNMLGLAEALHGFRWPTAYAKRKGVVDLYRDARRFRLLLQAQIDCLTPDGRFPPLSDTPVTHRPSMGYIELGLKRMPERYAGALAAIYPGRNPSEYAVLNLDAREIERARVDKRGLSLPEIYFPVWMTAILRHGQGPGAAMLTLHFSPAGGHRHLDNLSIYYMAGGKPILGDHGYLCDTPMNGWFRHTGSHNLVVVDGKEQSFRGANHTPRFHLMATTPKVSVVEASSKVYDQCTDYRRLVALIKGPGADTFVVDIFRVKGGKHHAYRIFSELAASDSIDGALEFDGVSLPPEKPLPQVGASTRREDIFGLRDVRRSNDAPAAWRAVWRQKDAAYRLWMLTPVDHVEASNGPGQETAAQAGRRVRYVDAIREGDDLSSVFVAIHEPSGAAGAMPVRSANLLHPPKEAGANAVALRIESEWGAYWVFADFAEEAEIEGIRFQGDFGVLCEESRSTGWLMAVGSTTLRRGDFGFSGQPDYWRGDVARNTTTTITSSSRRPAGWPTPPEWRQSYVRVHDGDHYTGFPVEATSEDTITVQRFPLPPVKAFELPALRYISIDKLK